MRRHSQTGRGEAHVEGGQPPLAVQQAAALPAAPVDGSALSHQAGSQDVSRETEESPGTASSTPTQDVNQGPPLRVLLQLLSTEPGSQTLEYCKTSKPVGDAEDLGWDMTYSEITLSGEEG